MTPASEADDPVWAAMLAALHGPDASEADFLAEIPAWRSLPEPMVAWIARDRDGHPIGMVDARVRNYAEGAPSLRAAYVEDLWVDERHRRRGVGRALLAAVEQWARAQGLDWIGSDTQPDNLLSQHWHEVAGFEVQERLIVFGKPL